MPVVIDIERIAEKTICAQILKTLEAMAVPVTAAAYRTKNQAEINLILEGPFGLIPIEIKSGLSIRPPQLQALRHFVQKHSCKTGIVITQHPQNFQIDEQIIHLSASET